MDKYNNKRPQIRVFYQEDIFDREYLFYENGDVVYRYDENIYKYNQERKMKIKDLDGWERKMLLEKCNADEREKLKDLFNKYA